MDLKSSNIPEVLDFHFAKPVYWVSHFKLLLAWKIVKSKVQPSGSKRITCSFGHPARSEVAVLEVTYGEPKPPILCGIPIYSDKGSNESLTLTCVSSVFVLPVYECTSLFGGCFCLRWRERAQGGYFPLIKEQSIAPLGSSLLFLLYFTNLLGNFNPHPPSLTRRRISPYKESCHTNTWTHTLRGKFTKNGLWLLIAPWFAHHLRPLSALSQGPTHKT